MLIFAWFLIECTKIPGSGEPLDVTFLQIKIEAGFCDTRVVSDLSTGKFMQHPSFSMKIIIFSVILYNLYSNRHQMVKWTRRMSDLLSSSL